MVDKILGKTETSFIYFNVLIFYKTLIFLIYFNTFYIRKTLRRGVGYGQTPNFCFFCFVLFFFTNTVHPEV